MKEKEKETNFFGKRKPQGKLVENFYVSQEEGNVRVKIEHKSGDFNFRLFCGERLKYWHDLFTTGESSQAYAGIFSGIKIFTIMAIQHPEFYRDYSLWVEEYFDKKKSEISDAEDKKIVDELKTEHEKDGELKDGLERVGEDGSEPGIEEGVGSDTDAVEGDPNGAGEVN